MKHCSKCKKEKLINEFYKNKIKPDGLGTQCKSCSILTMKLSKRKARIKAIKGYGSKCKCCGETEGQFLTFDHINGGGNKHRQQFSSQTDFYRWIIKNKFPNTLQILCFNCNCAKGFWGKCPHENYDGHTKV